MKTPPLDKTAFSVGSLYDESDEKAYWQTKTPLERLEAMELMRQIHYGYDPAAARLQRFLEVIKLDDLKRNKKAAGRHKDLGDLESLP